MSKLLVPIEDNRKTLAGQVHERVREAILNQVLKPGARIDQHQLAESLNVSVVPVREALRSLEAEGLVTIVPRRGAFVTEISLADLDDLYFARQIIEGEAIYHAVAYLQPDDFIHLQQLIDQMRESTANQDIRAFMSFNRQFHLHIYRALSNQHLYQTIEYLWERSELYRYRFMFVRRNADVIHQEHEAILAACRLCQPERARELAKLHIRHTQEGLHHQLETEILKEQH